jgi:hypothetical protein
LHPAYPNPFNPTTALAFDLPTTASVRLDVFDVLGRRVTTLIDSEMPAGSHTATWDAAGSASGIYFARLAANDATATTRMVLLK